MVPVSLMYLPTNLSATERPAIVDIFYLLFIEIGKIVHRLFGNVAPRGGVCGRQHQHL